MNRYVKVGELCTENKRDTELLIKLLDKAGVATCYYDEWGDGGASMYLMIDTDRVKEGTWML